eukprot:gb/GECG01002808.1/.p1 GENE.gb/GECG01002808.1/~~gb/GECG01002808.1/.p1  ORF type:complete len:177 (+),score=18.07 gb/GECG01002808.1/:1-531(+)
MHTLHLQNRVTALHVRRWTVSGSATMWYPHGLRLVSRLLGNEQASVINRVALTKDVAANDGLYIFESLSFRELISSSRRSFKSVGATAIVAAKSSYSLTEVVSKGWSFPIKQAFWSAVPVLLPQNTLFCIVDVPRESIVSPLSDSEGVDAHTVSTVAAVSCDNARLGSINRGFDNN